MKSFIVWIAVVATALALATSAYGQSSVQGYYDEKGQVQAQINDSGGSPPSGTSAEGSLPFTGLDIALLVGAGGLLLAVGFGMRRLTRAPESA